MANTRSVLIWAKARPGHIINIYRYRIRFIILFQSFHLIRATCLAFQHSAQLAFYHLLTQRRKVVDEHLTVQMVEFMLHYASQIAFYNFLVFHKILVHIFHANLISSFHCLMDTRQTQIGRASCRERV